MNLIYKLVDNTYYRIVKNGRKYEVRHYMDKDNYTVEFKGSETDCYFNLMLNKEIK